MAQQTATASTEAPEQEPPAEPPADVPASPASLWASEGKVLYSITHSGACDTAAWIDCECVVTAE